MLQNLLSPFTFAQAATSLFLAILFLQSGFDKVLNFADNLSWLQTHFAKTFLRRFVQLMLVTITLVELIAGALAAAGAGQIVLNGSKTLALYGGQVATVSVLLLFFGQRVAKDYAGAAALVPYFALCVAAVLMLSL
jgi:hypothetical protein